MENSASTRSQSVLIDDRARNLSALLAATDWPQREQAVKPHDVTPQAHLLNRQVQPFHDHPAARYLQAQIDANANLTDLFRRALSQPDNADIEASALDSHLTDFSAAAQSDLLWQTQAEAWQDARQAVEVHITGVDIPGFLARFYGPSVLDYSYLPNLLYPTNQTIHFMVDDRAYCLFPPRLAWGQNPPWPFSEDREYVLKIGMLSFSKLAATTLFTDYPDIVNYLTNNASELQALLAYGITALFLDEVEPGAGSAFIMIEKRQNNLVNLPFVVELLENYLETQTKGLHTTLAGYLSEFVEGLQSAE